jgi:hypothetical protein
MNEHKSEGKIARGAFCSSKSLKLSCVGVNFMTPKVYIAERTINAAWKNSSHLKREIKQKHDRFMSRK